jgi:hypothetical protein
MARCLRMMLVVLIGVSGCYIRTGLPLVAATVGAAVITAAIVSHVPPPPPRVVPEPIPRAAHEWQPGYWTVRNGHWVWVDGIWIPSQPGYRWAPAHWMEAPGGTWHLVPGEWIPIS